MCDWETSLSANGRVTATDWWYIVGCGDRQREEVVERWEVENKDFRDLVWEKRGQAFSLYLVATTAVMSC